jgi:hypothetical protein
VRARPTSRLEQLGNTSGKTAEGSFRIAISASAAHEVGSGVGRTADVRQAFVAHSLKREMKEDRGATQWKQDASAEDPISL